MLDRSAAVRAGEELDAQRLEAWLDGQLPGDGGPVVVEQFPGGYSNLTYLLRRGGREWVLRRPPFGNRVKSAHDMEREYRILSTLWPIYPPAPRPFALCRDESVLGAPFYVMERRRGIVLRGALPPGLELRPDTVRRLAEAFVDRLVELHGLDLRAAGLAESGRPEGYVQRQVEGWTRRYADARTHELPEMERTAAWLAERRPPVSGAALVHNDYKYDNLMLDPEDPARITAVFDWEMATVGDPLMDLGATLAYWVEPGDPEELRSAVIGPTLLEGNPTRRALAERYAEKSGRPVGDLGFYHAYGLFRLAVIIQQIYARYVRGHTRDARFAGLDRRVAALARAAEATTKGGAR